MGKCALILKDSTYSSPVVGAAVKDVSLFIPCTVLCSILLEVYHNWHKGYVRKLKTLHQYINSHFEHIFKTFS